MVDETDYLVLDYYEIMLSGLDYINLLKKLDLKLNFFINFYNNKVIVQYKYNFYFKILFVIYLNLY